jgi:soluble lytic murein transglycosylase-like protein
MRNAVLRLAVILAVAPVLALAEDAVVDPTNFTFKRLSVKDIAPGKRITVQIDPEEQALLLAANPWKNREPERAEPSAPLAPVAPAGGNYDWFWESVPVARDASDDRFGLALAALDNGPEGASVAAPRLQTMQNLAETWGTDILKETIGTNVSPALVLAVIGIESAGNPTAVSSAGATGLMQLIPATAERFGVTDATDPRQNIKGGVAYLDFLMNRFNRDPVLVLAAYNAGEGAVDANVGVPPYPETRDYVPKVLAAWTVAQGLCMTPPELVSDPCVFRIISASN